MAETEQRFFAMEPHYLRRYLERVGDIEKAVKETARLDSPWAPAAGQAILQISGDTAVIKIFGYLSRSGPTNWDVYFGDVGTGYTQILAALDEIKAYSQIDKIVLRVNSPGGEIGGLDEVWQQLYSMRSDYRITAQNIGLMASGAYYLSAAAHEITAVSPTALTGSIGVVVAFLDFTGAYEEMGIKRIVILSKNAPKKDVLNKAGQGAVQEEINALERIFYQRISEGRGLTPEQIAENFGKGGLLVAEDPSKTVSDALSVGMLDSVLGVAGLDIVDSGSDFDGPDTGKDFSPEKNKKQEKRGMEARKEQVKMAEEKKNLKALIAGDPALRTEFNEAVETARKAGGVAVEERVAKVVPYLAGGEKNYPETIRNLAISVLEGKNQVAALVGAATVIEAQKEDEANKAAVTATENQGETPPSSDMTGGTISPDGSVNNEADLEAAVKRAKGGGSFINPDKNK